MASTRLPGKPLADIAGLPMIVQVLRRAQAARLGPVVVACDDETIATAVEKAGGRAMMTRGDHPSGSDRIFEALGVVDPERRARHRRQRAGRSADSRPPTSRRRWSRSTIPRSISQRSPPKSRNAAERTNPNVVKVVGTPVGPAACTRSISPAPPRPRRRSALPSHRALRLSPGGAGAVRPLPPSPREQRERLEQLRALEAGMRIDATIVESVPLGVDTPQDLETARAMLR